MQHLITSEIKSGLFFNAKYGDFNVIMRKMENGEYYINATKIVK